MQAPVHESKKYASRIWLIIINILVLACGAFTIFSGVILVKNGGRSDMQRNNATYKDVKDFGKGKSTTFEKSQFEIFVKDIGIVFIVYGAFLLITAIAGITGACTRNNGFLTCFIAGCTFVFLLTLGVAIMSLVNLSNRLKNWSRLDALAWRAASNEDKDLAQWVFDCCGFSKGDNLAYRGPPLYEGQPPNKCANLAGTNGTTKASDIIGCHEAGQTFWSAQILFVSIAGGIILIILSTLICSAANSRRSYLADLARIKAGQQGGYVNLRDTDRAPLVSK
ncbi:hypothetical protein HDU96_004324 [Phlyctochytrium bullatum]|nr:hypothetical protein HDU96_004324 [Phlyctochytrium bullatum]